MTAVSFTGGGRVVVTPGWRSLPTTDRVAVLVHEFVHAVYSDDDVGLYFGANVTRAATREGAARLIEDVFRADPTGYQGRPFTILGPALRPHLSRFTGAVPTDGQVYGAADTAEYYYNLSATTFEYVASKYGVRFAVSAGSLGCGALACRVGSARTRIAGCGRG